MSELIWWRCVYSYGGCCLLPDDSNVVTQLQHGTVSFHGSFVWFSHRLAHSLPPWPIQWLTIIVEASSSIPEHLRVVLQNKTIKEPPLGCQQQAATGHSKWNVECNCLFNWWPYTSPSAKRNVDYSPPVETCPFIGANQPIIVKTYHKEHTKEIKKKKPPVKAKGSHLPIERVQQ